jgi:hypothetical protein
MTDSFGVFLRRGALLVREPLCHRSASLFPLEEQMSTKTPLPPAGFRRLQRTAHATCSA